MIEPRTHRSFNTPDEPTEAQPQIQLHDSSVQTMLELAIVVLRYLVVIAGAITAAFSFIETKDLAGFLVFAKSEQATGAIAAAGAVGTIGIGLWRTYVKRRRTMVAAKAAPDAIATVTTT